ncbi:MAG: nuclear transport factor 2 family protein [Pseudonocardia sp.]|nr:nuclear transport factor 2 family protein [Pseudonocardia sp.]
MSEDFVGSFLPRHDAAHAQVVTGDPEAWLALWSRREPVIVFGAFGYVGTGREQVEATVRKASARLTGGSGYRNEVLNAQVVGDVAYTASLEHSLAPADGSTPAEITLRVTQVYRLEDGKWRIAHRHGDIVAPTHPGVA